MSVDLTAEIYEVTLCHASGLHAWSRSSEECRAWTVRVKEGMAYWDCPFCRSSHCRIADVETRVERITDFDDVEPATKIDDVSWLVSDEMMAADRAQRERAFAVSL